MPTRTRFGDLADCTAELVEQLTNGRFLSESMCHLDPDLHAPTLTRQAGWRGALGQVAAAQGHLRMNGVTAGDLFLFWGLFRPAVCDRTWRFDGPPEHRIFGWLQVDVVLNVGSDSAAVLAHYPWLSDHPHTQGDWPSSNTIYIACERLRLNGCDTDWPGWGLFRRGHRLTVKGAQRVSQWQTPDWLNPRQGGVGMTYHPLHRWNEDGTVTCAARGQEFVADIGTRPDAIAWLLQLFRDEV